MPIIDVPANDWEALTLAMARLCIDPTSLAATEHVDRKIKGDGYLTAFKILGSANMELSDEEILLMAESQAIPAPTPSDKQSREFVFAGFILMKALRLAYYIDEQASLRKAIDLVAADLKNTPAEAKSSTLWAAWSKFQSVSHFSAAWFFVMPLFHTALMAMATAEDNGGDAIPPQNKFAETEKAALREKIEREARPVSSLEQDAFPKLFAIAEELRLLGQRHRSHGQKAQEKSLLDPKTMWSVPKAFDLPPIKINLGPPLTESEMRIIGVVN